MLAALAGLALWPAAPLASRAAGFDLAALTRLLGRNESGEALFREERHVAQIDQLLHASGRLSFSAPDVFVRETLQPRRERMAVNGNRLTLTQGGRTRTMALDATPEALVMVEAIRGTLTGRRDVLEKHFEVRLSGDAALWQLELVPRDTQVRAQVPLLRLTGQQAQVRELRVSMANGDRSVMQIEPLDGRTSAPATPRP
ncbi:outer membrane lipoprotein carrier protein LolA [Ramlibacter aurantiacus]|nr:outer membrane lipoprotein carrier protein LolA [Ramlibacter aurantiacus]